MTNAQSKYAVCEENYPIPVLNAKAQQQLINKAMREQGWEGKGRMKHNNTNANCRYELGWDWTLFRYYVKFDYA